MQNIRKKVPVHKYKYAYVYIYIYIYIHMHACTNTHLYIYIHTRVCVCACICAHLHNMYLRTCICTYKIYVLYASVYVKAGIEKWHFLHIDFPTNSCDLPWWSLKLVRNTKCFWMFLVITAKQNSTNVTQMWQILHMWTCIMRKCLF